MTGVPDNGPDDSHVYSNDPAPVNGQPQKETPLEPLSFSDEVDLDPHACADIVTQFTLGQFEKSGIEEKLLSMDQQRTLMRQRIAERLQEKGVKVSDAQLDAEINKYFENRLVFQPAQDATLARMYVNRNAIAKKTGIASLVLAAAIALPFGAAKGINYLNEIAAESAAETHVLKVYAESAELLARTEILRASSLLKDMPADESALVIANLDIAKGKVLDAEAAVRMYAYVTKQKVSEAVTRENAADAVKACDTAYAILVAGKDALGSAEKMVKRQELLVTYSQSIESSMRRIRASDAPTTLIKQADQLYSQALVAKNDRRVEALGAYETQLSGKASDAETLTNLADEVEKAYARIKDVSKEDAARTKGDELYKTAKTSIENADVPAAQSSMDSMRQTETALNEAYTLIVTGGNWRYPVNNPGAKNHYLIVEARDGAGNRVSRRIRNEETGQTESVTRWGERVPEGAYELVKRDKQDNGLIDTNRFGEKEKGYLEERITFIYNGAPLRKTGQITRWEE